ncbi:fibrinogen C domain-containing protein 1-like isoform X1 [Sander lucioperca]|uniref:fibrinogen C domain-containing protein 1-like isoform X1 n=1 Tax=Sander lucioperca TaxID=283035 RepID=UPI001653E4BA|nr:fibrinogen C domain-containing protein 1-like isoform X1 [Sander lucioperca]
MFRMKWQFILLTFVFLTRWFHQPVTGDFAPSDEHPDIGHDEDVHPNTLTETNGDVLDMNIQTSRDVPDTNFETNWDINKDNFEDADWHPPPSLLETHSDLSPEIGTLSAQCGEYSSHLTSSGHCRLMATLPPVPVGTSQKRCPDMFRCTDDISNWLHENQNRKEQLDDLTETMSELQEELRNHGHRITTLEEQGVESVSLNLTFDQRLRFLELRHTEVDTLFHVHATLLYELQAQLRNLSAAVQRMSRRTGCKINDIRTSPLLSMRDTPARQHLSFCSSDCASLYHNGVRHSGVYNIVLSPGTILPVYCDMKTEGGGWTVFQRRRDGLVSFNRGWSEYRDGFGEPRGEHWLGNQQLHLLSNQGHYSLRIELQDWSHVQRHALYHSFRIENEENHYRLHVSGFSGTVEDSFGWYHDQQGFSTPDTGNICAEISHAGWWFHQCFYANLNGVYYRGGRYSLKAQNLLGPDGIVWFSWKDSDFYSLKAVTMMIRPRNFRPRLSP